MNFLCCQCKFSPLSDFNREGSDVSNEPPLSRALTENLYFSSLSLERVMLARGVWSCQDKEVTAACEQLTTERLHRFVGLLVEKC